MKFEIKSVASVEENIGFRVIGCLVSETEEEKTEFLPQMCEGMSDVLKCYAKAVQPEVSDNVRVGFVEKTIFYRAISLPELAFVLKQFNKGLPFKTTVCLADDVKMFPENIREIFNFQLECFKQQNDL